MRSIELTKMSTGLVALDGFVAGMLLAAVTLIAALVHTGPGSLGYRPQPRAGLSGRVVPSDSVPEVEPITFKAMTPDEARAFNAAIPFSTDRNPAARPFRFAGGDEDRLRALDCLTAAVLYEAGDDPVGQRAVAQVVLNRVRHPAFPRTVCDVVFQGSERRTGCQFTFTCDGALNRTYSDPLWERARVIADAALSGAVYKPVGQATHYHTDWVVPYWSSSLDKIVAVDTHLFFRWTGWWGTPPAFRFNATGIEPRLGQLAARFPEHALLGPNGLLPAAKIPGTTAPLAISDAALKPRHDNPNTFMVLLSATNAPSFPEIAAFACGSRPSCNFMGWIDPAKLPRDDATRLAPDQLAAASFSYVRDRSRNVERALWNCTQFKRADEQCMGSKPAPPETKLPIVSETARPVIPTLDGIRYKGDKAPAPQP